MDNYVGKRLDGRYEVQEIVGVGGMSVVYKAYDNVDDRIVAVKILKDEFLKNDEFVRRFKNESKAIAVMSHPNIVKVYDVSFGEKLQYIVMEYVDGITLKEYIQKQGAITWNDALYFTTQILKALQHAHDKGIVHRDIKPQNIILLSNGVIKVTDFGIARFSRSETKTLTENAIGSVHYISPEQAKGEFTDERADIYSLGVVLYEMLAGKVPFEADSAVSVALMQVQADAKRLTDINPDIPKGVEQICSHAMEKDPANRYQTATEMLFDVEEVIKNPATTFDYSFFVDEEPTKYVLKTDKQNAAPVAEPQEEELQEYEDPNRKKKIATAVIVGVIVLAAAIVLLVMGITGSFNTKTVKLENFVGQSYDEIISSNAYDYEFIQQSEKSDQYDPGIVISQSPEAGSRVIKGSKVTLVVCAPDEDIQVPNCYGVDEEKAKKLLANEGLYNYSIKSVPSDSVEEGMVVYTDPKASTVVSADQTITIFISSGPSTTQEVLISVPDVSGLTQSGARAFLEKYGFTNITFTTEDNAAPKDTVIDQSPAAGEAAAADDKIKVVISSGVTTTLPTTQKIDMTVKLPNTGKSDNIVVYLDGNQYSSSEVMLDGTSKVYSISVDYGDKVEIEVELKGISASEKKVVTANKDKSVSIDFSEYSADTTDTDTE